MSFSTNIIEEYESQLAALREEHSELVDAYAKMQTGEEKMLNRVISERDALREDLAKQAYKAELYDEIWPKATGMGFMNVTMALAEIPRLQHRLADAERRNAELDAQLSKAIDFVERLCASTGSQPSIATGYLRDILDALNPKPEAASHDE